MEQLKVKFAWINFCGQFDNSRHDPSQPMPVKEIGLLSMTNPLKPSRQIKPGDLIKVNRPSHIKKIHVIKVLKCRVAAKCLNDYIEDLTHKMKN